MATAKDKFVEKHFLCVICQDEYKDPRRLSCQHVLCRKCLQELIDTSAGDRLLRRRNEWIIGFNCPECRKIIRIPRPWEPQDRWAKQITADFKTANIQADIRDGIIILSEPNNCMKSEAEVENIASRISKVEVQTDPAEQRVRPEIERDEKMAVNTESSESLPTRRTRTAMKGELLRVISPQADDKRPDLYDFVVLVQGENRLIVTLDFQDNKIITLKLNKEMKVLNTSSHHLGCKPWRICKVNSNQVAVTVSGPEGVLMCSIDIGITVERLFQSRKHYDGIALLTGNRFVLTTNDNVDIVKKDGSVLQEYKVSAPHVKYSDNSYVACTTNQNIVVTDCGGKTVSCVTQEGKVAWRKKMNPLGVACDSDERVYFVDCEVEVVYQFTNRGRFLCKVVEKSESFSKPSGVAVDGTGFMYVICNFKDITVWKLCPPEDAGQ